MLYIPKTIKYYLISIYLLGIVISVNSQNSFNIPEAEFETTINQPKKILKVNDGHYFIDFGKAYFGTVQLETKNDYEGTLDIHLGEKLTDTKTIDRNPGGTIRYQKITIGKFKANQVKTIGLQAYERNTKPPAILLPDSFGVVLPFRYCEIENLKIPIEDIQIHQKAFHYKFYDESSHFSSSDKVLNAIWDLCKHSIKATSFTGFYIDGDRERIPYEADAYINQLSHYCVDSVYSLARRTNIYFLEHPTWPTEWILHTVLMFYSDYLYTGDLEVLKKYYDLLKVKTLVDLERDDGLISAKSDKLNGELMLKLGFDDPETRIRDVVDWPPGQKDTGWKLATQEGERDGYEMVDVNTVVNAFYYRNLILMSEIAGFLGKTEDSKYWMEKSTIVKKTINQKLFDRSRGIYIDGEGSNHASLHANMFPLAFDLVPEENIETVINFVKSRDMACSVYGSQYLLEGLYKNDESAHARHLITDTINDRSWWNMIKVGSTITLEAWDMKYKPNLDWNHAWGAAPANIITRYMWGIIPKSPGFKTVQIRPQLDDLNYSEIKVPTINGIIYAKFELVNKQHKIYEIELPENVNGQFILKSDAAEIILNNKLITGNKEILKLESGLNIIELKN
jgi:alpha-L-rhamnosidase